MADIELELENASLDVKEVKDSQSEIMAMRSLRRNTWAALIDSGMFGAALGFIGYSTVLPTMALALTKPEPYVGLITTLWSGMWLLPQLPAGRRLAGRMYNKPVLVKAAFFSRIALLAMALALLLTVNPVVLAVLLPIVIMVFRGLDAVAAVAWFDVISKAFL